MPHTLIVLLLAVLTALFSRVGLMPGTDAEHEDHVVSREVLRDPEGMLTVTDMATRPFTRVPGIFAGGYTRDAVWMRLKVRPEADGRPLVLRILPAYLNEIILHEPDPDRPGLWRTRVSGNRVPWRDRPLEAIPLGFTLQPAGEATYYLRLSTASNALLDVQALPQRDAAQEAIYALLWQGLYMAVILWIILWSLQDWWLSRDRVILIFAGVYLVYLLYVLAILGYVSPLLPAADYIPELTFWCVTLAVPASLLFHRELLLLYAIARPARWGINALLGSCGVSCGLLLLGQTTPALTLNSLIAFLAAPVLFLAALTAGKEVSPGRKRLRIYYGLLLLSIVTYIAPVLGLTPRASDWTLYGALIQGLISALLFGDLLHTRSRQLRDEEARAQFKLALSHHQLAMHAEQLAERSRFTAMLTHELKNPLATIRLSLDSLQGSPDPLDAKRHHRIDRAMGDIDALVERCVLADNIEQGRQELRMQDIDVAELYDECVKQHREGRRARIQTEPARAVVTSDAQLLSVVLANLLDNALKYSPAGSPVDVRLRAEAGAGNVPGLEIEVSNRPPPGDLPDPARVFEKYYRGRNSAGRSGTGIGLYLVKELAERLGGRIEYLPQSDRIVFRLWIPQTPP